MPFYLGRTAWFIDRYAARDFEEIEAGAEALAAEFERQKQDVLDRWPSDVRR